MAPESGHESGRALASCIGRIVTAGPSPSAYKELAELLNTPDVPESLRYHTIAACSAWFAAGRSMVPDQIVPTDRLHPYTLRFLRGYHSEVAERREILSGLTKLLFDVAAVRDQLSGSATLCIVSQSFTTTNLELTAENLFAQFYMTPQHLSEATILETNELQNIIQIFIETFGVRAPRRLASVYDVHRSSTSHPITRTEPPTTSIDRTAHRPRIFYGSPAGTRWGPPAPPATGSDNRAQMQQYREELATLQAAVDEKDGLLVEYKELYHEVEEERNELQAENAILRQELEATLAPAPPYEEATGEEASPHRERALSRRACSHDLRANARHEEQGQAHLDTSLQAFTSVPPPRIPSEAVSRYMRCNGLGQFYVEVATIYAYTKRESALARIAALNMDDEHLNGLLRLAADDL